MPVPTGAIVRDDGAVEIRPAPYLSIMLVVLIVICLFMAIGMPIDQLNEGRMNGGIIVTAVIGFLVALAAAYWLVFRARRPILRIDDVGVHRIANAPYALAAWEDISEIQPGLRGGFSLVLPNGWLKKDGSRSRQKRLILSTRAFQSGTQLYSYIGERWLASRQG